jgi:hypothetical protein
VAFGPENRGTLVPLGPHLFLHRVLDGLRGVNGLDFDPVHPQPPLAGGLVQHPTQLAVDGVAGGEGALQVHGSNDIAQCGNRELFDALQEAGDLVGGCAWVGHLKVEHCVDLDDQVVFGDDRLWSERNHLLSQVDFRIDPVDIGDDEVKARLKGSVVAAEPLDVARTRLGDDTYRPKHGEGGQHSEDQSGDERHGGVHWITPGGRRVRWRR